MRPWRDGPTEVRPGEELRVTELRRWLREHLNLPDASLQVQQFPAGYSNLTYCLRVGDREFVLRRPPLAAAVPTGHDMSREYRVLSHLHPVYAPAPRPLAYCADAEVIGAPFYVMERRHGVVLRREIPAGLQLDEEIVRRLSESLVDQLAELHAVDYEAAGLGELGRPEGYVERQVAGWRERYEKAKTAELPEMDGLGPWLSEHRPPDSGAALIHNDFKYDNILFDEDDLSQVVAVLDWEMCTVGDPLMDLGTALCYWVEAGDDEESMQGAFGPTHLPGALTRSQVLERYCERTGRDLREPVFYYAYGLYKLAVIVQQIYARYRSGGTQDARFAALGERVRIFARDGLRAVERGHV